MVVPSGWSVEHPSLASKRMGWSRGMCPGYRCGPAQGALCSWCPCSTPSPLHTMDYGSLCHSGCWLPVFPGQIQTPSHTGAPDTGDTPGVQCTHLWQMLPVVIGHWYSYSQMGHMYCASRPLSLPGCRTSASRARPTTTTTFSQLSLARFTYL